MAPPQRNGVVDLNLNVSSTVDVVVDFRADTDLVLDCGLNRPGVEPPFVDGKVDGGVQVHVQVNVNVDVGLGSEAIFQRQELEELEQPPHLGDDEAVAFDAGIFGEQHEARGAQSIDDLEHLVDR
jgi:hypothetical protein